MRLVRPYTASALTRIESALRYAPFHSATRTGMNLSAICPACGVGNHLATAGKTILSCRTCTHSWMPLPEATVNVLAEAAYTEVYEGYRPDPFQLSAFRRLLATDLARLVPPPATLLDVGCGNGAFMEAAKEAGYTVRGIDISTSSAAICARRGLDAIAGSFLTHEFGQRFDLITMWDVLEHLSRPSDFLRRTRELLSPMGKIAGKIPAFGTLSVNLSRQSRRAAAVMLGAPDHIQYFTPRSLQAMFSHNRYRLDPLHGHQRLHSPATGGPLRTQAIRRVRQGLSKLSGDRNLFFAARPL